MKKIYLLIFGVGWAILLMAYNGVFNKSNDGWTYRERYETFSLYVDMNSIKKYGDFGTIKYLTNNNLTDEQGVRSSVTNILLDCNQKLNATLRVVNFSEKMAKGKILDEDDYSDEIEWEIVAGKNTMGRDVFNLVCNNLKP